jgi:DNA segregation ATPase FtsK/SpoIIIE, S-DNA-T family
MPPASNGFDDDENGESNGGGDSDDPLFEDAVRLVVTSRHASTSMIQRKFKIGYNRAARLLDEMEDRGIVGALDGAKPREILVSRDQLDDMFLTGYGE